MPMPRPQQAQNRPLTRKIKNVWPHWPSWPSYPKTPTKPPIFQPVQHGQQQIPWPPWPSCPSPPPRLAGRRPHRHLICENPCKAFIPKSIGMDPLVRSSRTFASFVVNCRLPTPVSRSVPRRLICVICVRRLSRSPSGWIPPSILRVPSVRSLSRCLSGW